MRCICVFPGLLSVFRGKNLYVGNCDFLYANKSCIMNRSIVATPQYPHSLNINQQRRQEPMLQIAVCEDEQADRDNLTGILKPLLDKYTEEYHIKNFTSGGECCNRAAASI